MIVRKSLFKPTKLPTPNWSYSKHLADSITKEYKRNSPTTIEKIDEEAASVATNLKSTASTPAYPRLIINPLYNLLENCKL